MVTVPTVDAAPASVAVPARIGLLVLTGFVALTALAGGVALVVGVFVPEVTAVITPPAEYLEGSPFASYLVPGLVLAVVLGGIHLIAFALLVRRARLALAAVSAAGFASLIWIFVQMTIIPFSALQALYFAVGIVELGLVLLMLGVLPDRRSSQP